MEEAIETLTRGNVAEVKVLLASIALALAVYQLVLIAVGYGKLRLPFLAARPASRTHRAGAYGFEDDGLAHGLVGFGLFIVLFAKVAVVRRGLGLGRFLPVFGTGVFLLLAVTWALSAGDFLGGS